MTDTSSISASAAPKGLSSFVLKAVAIAGMTANHAAYMFYPYLPDAALCMMFALGGITFPVMAFLLVEGYRYTSNIKRYGMRLLAFAAVAEIPYWLFLSHDGNVLFTLLIGLVILYLYDHQKDRTLFWLSFAGLTALSALCDWGVLGPIMILMFRALEDERQRLLYPILLAVLSVGLPALSDFASAPSIALVPAMLYPFVGCLAAFPLLKAYNGLRGLPMKWFFYAYYPLHILVLGLAKGLLLGDWSLGH